MTAYTQSFTCSEHKKAYMAAKLNLPSINTRQSWSESRFSVYKTVSVLKVLSKHMIMIGVINQ